MHIIYAVVVCDGVYRRYRGKCKPARLNKATLRRDHKENDPV